MPIASGDGDGGGEGPEEQVVMLESVRISCRVVSYLCHVVSYLRAVLDLPMCRCADLMEHDESGAKKNLATFWSESQLLLDGYVCMVDDFGADADVLGWTWLCWGDAPREYASAFGPHRAAHRTGDYHGAHEAKGGFHSWHELLASLSHSFCFEWCGHWRSFGRHLDRGWIM